MKKIVLLIVGIFLTLQAQSLLGVRYPAGIVSPRTGTAARMGGFGIGSQDAYNMMAYNPGNLGNIDHSVYSLKFTLDWTKIFENDASADFVTMVPDLVGFAFPLGKAGTFGLSFSKERGTSYTYVGTDGVLIENETTGEELTGWTGYFRKTGVTAWELGWGHSAWKFFRPGLTFRRFYFTSSENSVVKVDNFGGTGDSTHFSQSGNGLRGGFSGSIGNVSYGVSGNYSFYDEMDYERKIISIDTGKSLNGTTYYSELIHENAQIDTTFMLHLPPSGGAGFSYEPNKRLLIGTDFSMEFWERANTTGPKSIFYTDYQNTISSSTGFQYIPAPELLSPKYWQKIRYSAGFRYSTLPIKGDWEASLSAGVGLPLGAAGLLDLSFEGGTRRSEICEDNKENFFRFSITTNGGKKWIKKSNTVY